MSQQKKIGSPECSRCGAPAVWGLFAWKPGQTDVDINKPPSDLRCQRHKYTLKLVTRGGPMARWVGLKIRVEEPAIPQTIPTMRFVAEIPPTAGRTLGMCNFRGRVLIATEFGGVLEVQHDFHCDSYRLVSVDHEHGMAEVLQGWDANGSPVPA